MIVEIIIKVVSALVVGAAFVYAWQLGRKYGLSRQPGWLNIELGFGLTLLASLLVLTENVAMVRRLLVIGGSDYRYYLTFGSYLLGFVSMIIGGWKWLPALIARQQSDALQAANARLRQESSERSRAEEVLRESERRYRQIIEETSDIVYTINPEGYFTYVNPPGQRFTGYTENELMGMHFTRLIPAAWLDRVKSVYSEQIDKVQPETMLEFPYITKSGAEKWVEQKVTLLIKDGEVTGLQSIVRDISERKEAEEVLQQAHLQLEEKVEERTAELKAAVTSLQTEIGERKRAEKEILQRTEDLTLINEINNAINRGDSLQEVFHLLSRQSKKTFSGHGAAVYLLSEDKKYLTLQLTPGIQKLVGRVEKLLHRSLPEIRVLLNSGGRHFEVLESGAPQIISTPAEIDALLGDYINVYNLPGKKLRELACSLIPKVKDMFSLRSFLLVPLISGDETLGLLDYARKEPFTQEDLQRFVTIAQQMTTAIKRKQAEEALALEEERLRTTLRSISDGVIATDVTGNIILMNHAAAELTGWPLDLAQGKPISDVFKSTGDGKPFELALASVLRGNIKPIQNPNRQLVTRDGKERPVAGSMAPLGNSGEKVKGMVLVFQDISQRQQLEHEMLRSHKLESLGVLASGLAHDFNNFLMSIMLNVVTAKLKSDQNADVKTLLESAEQSITKAKAITQQLLTFSRGGDPVKSGMRLQPLVEECVKFALHGRPVASSFDLPDDLWPVDVDSGQINQVINNLVLNAVEAMPDGGRLEVSARTLKVKEGEARIALEPGDYVELKVTDEGEGIPDAIIDFIFDPYFTTRDNGNGLGLFSCYNILTRHGGGITVASEVGRGTTFTVYLPAAKRGELAAEQPVITRGSGRVLVMDDDDTIRLGLAALLGELGYDVTTTAAGEEAVEIYTGELTSEHPIDVVILDLTVPTGMGGAETIKHLHAVDPQVKAVVSSGYANDPVLAQYRDYGFQGILVKPFRPEDLSQVMDALIHAPRPDPAPVALP